jgi:hypothetical protein
MILTARQVAIYNMTAAFKLWEEEYRANPDGFMDAAATRARTPGDLGELRALYFAELLDKVDRTIHHA